MNGSARLLVRIGAQPETEYKLTQATTIVGRESINDLVLDDPEVSRRHCRVILDEEGYLIEDLGSTNGTFVNGQRVTMPTVLYHGDTIELGKTVRVVFLNEAPELGPEPDADLTQPIVRPQRARAPMVVPEDPEVGGATDYYEADEDRPIIVSPEEMEEGDMRRYVLSCGCLILLFIFLVGATLFILDRTAPDFLYCGPLENFWRAVLDPFFELSNQTLDCG